MMVIVSVLANALVWFCLLINNMALNMLKAKCTIFDPIADQGFY